MTWKPHRPLLEYSVAELDLVRRRAGLTPEDVDAVEGAISALSVMRGELCPWLHGFLTSFVTIDGHEWSEHGAQRRAEYAKQCGTG